MLIVKLDATDSTNRYLKELLLSEEAEDFTVVTAKEQLHGRGQRGAKWESESGKNLTISVLKKFKQFPISNQFMLNVCVSLAVLDTLNGLRIPDLTVKWPNDILSGTSKICGILIENMLNGSQIQTSIIGVGLNVNQQTFNTLSNASSLKLLLGRTLNLEEVLHQVLNNLKTNFLRLEEGLNNELWRRYESKLFRKDKPSTFKDAQGNLFMGFIRKISPQGKLVVELEDAVFQEFDLKEIKLQY
ncbi:biotin--[acetyl-CoA-carboxylase] ligase [Maribacter algarum]|uniref:Biotin--[acetyl-CoA-carboxylase] ligase n=1 Tax=Maribacter algarum (ex Zhang et al. 2020) TaxID=2578118 RepID=A0A5S3QFN0_9FLAO|nr:biotin--[acetyl-CoA-carboxylase] ligase [Maribacter algarum]TMM56087.1 biotin--[acetyl-CoA-carboxylase] ligase [Maribacter algarum]